MRIIFNRIIKSILLAAGFTLFLFYIFIWTLSLPINDPDKTLKIGRTVTIFLDQITLPIKLTRLSWLPADKEVLMPVYGIRVREIQNSWNAPRPDERLHEGQDIFADKGTPVFSATYGYIVRLGIADIGGNYVYIAGPGNRRYYYAHFDRIADGLKRGQAVTTDTVLGFVGNTGNAINTPAHLHFGVYTNRKAVDPLPLLINR